MFISFTSNYCIKIHFLSVLHSHDHKNKRTLYNNIIQAKYRLKISYVISSHDVGLIYNDLYNNAPIYRLVLSNPNRNVNAVFDGII